MAVVISQIVTEVVVGPAPPSTEEEASPDRDELIETVVRRASERVLEILRREWDA